MKITTERDVYELSPDFDLTIPTGAALPDFPRFGAWTGTIERIGEPHTMRVGPAGTMEQLVRQASEAIKGFEAREQERKAGA